jgi:aromatase
MSERGFREAGHEITVYSPAEDVYRLIAGVENWPLMFPPTVHVDHVERGEKDERIRIWATANGEAKQWTSHRELDPDGLRIDFRQEVSAPPVAAMGGSWIVEQAGQGTSRVRLLHSYRAVDDDAESLRWIEAAVERNSRSELVALKAHAESAASGGELMTTFEDSVRINGSAKDVYDFINEADRWPERLPHVARVRFAEPTPGLQTLEMDTTARDGSAHTTTSVRVCFPHHKIVYKQTQLPALMSLHTGQWTLTDSEAGVTAASRHTVAVNPASIAAILGPDAGIEDASRYLRTALTANSLATLGHARDYAERRS